MRKLKPMPRKRQTIVFDADGTIFHYDGWRGEDHVGPPLPGVVDFIRLLDWCGYDVVVSTARSGAGLATIKRAVEYCGIPVKEVTNIKPVGALYIDDRGYRFNGDWAEAQKEIAAILMEPSLS